jgi:hypothetical protein
LNNANNANNRPDRVLPPRGDYQTLLSFQKAEVVYDITFRFAHKYLSRGDRTIDQMIQSARSGKQNILEGLRERMTKARLNFRNEHPQNQKLPLIPFFPLTLPCLTTSQGLALEYLPRQDHGFPARRLGKNNSRQRRIRWDCGCRFDRCRQTVTFHWHL